MQHYGLGFAAAIPSGANPTPVPFAFINGLSVSFKPTYKKWNGNYVHTKFAGLASVETTGKIETINILAAVTGLATNTTVQAASASYPTAIPVAGENHSNLAGGTFTASNTTGFVDYGLWNLTTGVQEQRVASAPAAGQYTVTSGGVYAMNVSENGNNFLCNYSYTSTTIGKTVPVIQQTGSLVTGVQLVGFAPSTSGKPFGIKIYNAVIDDDSFVLKSDDLVAHNVSFFAMEDPTTGKVADVWTGE